MADKKEEESTEEESAPAEKKSSNMLMIIIIIVLFLIIIIGGVVAYLLMGNDPEPAQDTKQVQEQPKSKSKKSVTNSSSSSQGETRDLSEIGTLYPLDTFTVNLKSDSGRRYLKVTLSLEIDGEELSTELDAKTAVLRDKIIRILTSKTLEEISSRKGKQKVSQQIVDALNAMISKGSVRAVYFTEFVIQ